MDAHAQIIIAAKLTDGAADNAELPKLLQALRENTEAAPQMAQRFGVKTGQSKAKIALRAAIIIA